MAGPDGVTAVPGEMRIRTKLRIGQPLALQTFDWIIPQLDKAKPSMRVR